MGRKSTKPSVGKEAQLQQPSRPPQQWQAAHDALALYRRGKRERALAELDALLQGQPSGAACLARAKLQVTQAIDAGLKADTPEERERRMLPLLCDALRLAAEGAVAHNSLACALLAAHLAFATTARGTPALSMEPLPPVRALADRLGGVEGRQGAGAASSMQEGWAPPSWDDCLKDRWQFEIGHPKNERLGPQEYTRRSVERARELITNTIHLQRIASISATMDLMRGADPASLQPALKLVQVPADKRLALHLDVLREDDEVALRRRYEEEARQAQRGPVAAHGPARQQQPEAQGRVPERVVQKQLKQSMEVYVKARQRAAKVGEFLEQEVLPGMSDEELQQSGVLRLTEVPLSELRAELERDLSPQEAERVMDAVQRARSGGPVYYAWPQEAGAELGASNSGTEQSAAAGAAAAPQQAQQQRGEYLDAPAFEAVAQDALFRSASLKQVERLAGLLKRQLKLKTPPVTSAVSCLLSEVEPPLPTASLKVRLVGGDMEAFLDRSGAILRSRQPPSKAARTAMSPAAEPAASPAATEAGVEGSAGPASAAAGSSAAAAGGGNLAAEAAAPPPAVAAAAADEEEGREDTEQEPHSDWVQLLMLHRAAGGQLLRSGAGHTSYEFAARDVLGPVAWLEMHRSQRDHNRAQLGSLDGSYFGCQAQVTALVALSVNHGRKPEQPAGAQHMLQLTRDIAAMRRYLVGSHLLALGAEAAHGAAGSVDMAQLLATRQLLDGSEDSDGLQRALLASQQGCDLQNAADQLLYKPPEEAGAGAGREEEEEQQQQQERPATPPTPTSLPGNTAAGAEQQADALEAALVAGEGSVEARVVAALRAQQQHHKYSPIEDGALLGLLRLPLPPEDATPEQSTEHLLEVKRDVADAILAALSQLRARGRLHSGALAAISLFIWRHLLESAEHAEQRQQQEQEQQGGAAAGGEATAAQRAEQRRRRKTEFEALYWQRRPEALAAQLVHVGQLGLLPLLQLHAYLALLYYDSFAAVGDICPDFQERLLGHEALAELDSGRAAVRLTELGLARLGQEKGGVEQAKKVHTVRPATQHPQGHRAMKQPPPAAAPSASAAGHSAAGGAASGAGQGEADAAPAPRAAAASALQALAEHGWGASEALREVVKCKRALAGKEESIPHSAHLAHRIRLLLGLLCGLCPELESAHSMLARLHQARAAVEERWSLFKSDSAAAVQQTEPSWLHDQADALAALAEDATDTFTAVGGTLAGLEVSGNYPIVDQCQLALKANHYGPVARQLLEAAHQHYETLSRQGSVMLMTLTGMRAGKDDAHQCEPLWDAGERLRLAARFLERCPTPEERSQRAASFVEDLSMACKVTAAAAGVTAEQLSLDVARLEGALEAMHSLAKALTGMLCMECCSSAFIDDVAKALVHHVLPQRWERQMEQARAQPLLGSTSDDIEAELLRMDQEKAAAAAARQEKKREKKKAKKAEKRAASQQEQAQQGEQGQAQQQGEGREGGPAAAAVAAPVVEAAGACPAAARASSTLDAASAASGEASPAAAPTTPAIESLQQAPAAAEEAGPHAESPDEGGWQDAKPARRAQRAKQGPSTPTTAAPPAASAQASSAAAAPALAAHGQEQQQPVATSDTQQEHLLNPRLPAAAAAAPPEPAQPLQPPPPGAAAASAEAPGPEQQQPASPAAAAAQPQLDPAEDEWQDVKKPKGRKGARAGPTAGGPPERGGSGPVGAGPPLQRPLSGSGSFAGKPAQAQEEVLRIVTWMGDWQCPCGRMCFPRQHCRRCGQLCPCRDWVFDGGCTRRGCMFPHPPFDLPAKRPVLGPDGKLPDGTDVVKPHPKAQLPQAAAGGARGPGGKPSPASLAPLALRAGQQQGAAPATPAVEPATAPGATPLAQPASLAAGCPASPGRQSLAELPSAQQEQQERPSTAPSRPDHSHAEPASPSSAAAATAASPRGLNPNGAAWVGGGQAAAAAAAKAAAAPAAGAWSAHAQQQRRQAVGPLHTGWGMGVEAGASPQEQEDPELQALLNDLGVGPAAGSTDGQPWPAPGQTQEDADMQAALAASLVDAQVQGAAADATTAAAEGLAAPTLANEAGEYNCFLNAVLQCLWYCAKFRREVASWPAEFYTADPVVHALHELFQAFADTEHAGQNGSAAPRAGTRAVINPAPLREALATLGVSRFQVGEMNDAAELLLTIYEHVRAVAAKQGLPAGVEALFGLAVREAVECSRCHKTTHQSAYTQYFLNTQATALRLVALQEGEGASLGRLLRTIEQQARKTCDTDEGGCGEWNGVNHFLERPPRVFSLQLAWESQREEAGDIAATLAAVEEQVDLGEVYQAVEPGRHVYRLRSLVCYYGAHYQAFVLVPDLGRWLMFDDTRVANIGTWADVRKKCELGHIQPSVLFWEVAEPREAAGGQVEA